ncbi:MAG: nitrogen permease regulator 2-domain-containing protein, partial [Olpidium bornovanus]
MSVTASFPTIVAIFYSEFHPVQGPRVMFEVPEGFVGLGGGAAASAAAAAAAAAGSSSQIGQHPGALPSAAAAGTPKAGAAGSQGAAAASPASSMPFAAASTSPAASAGAAGAATAIAAPPALDYDELSEYIIPKSELCDKLITLRTDRYKVLGYPVSIVDRKYERNALLFNLAFVFDQDAETCSYEPVVRKMARVLRNLE